ncbi:hypothetical protein HDV00_012818 [Rhizophlyctis rosea]|nr:hypothetical protein HDV00_012818 [Rhizophlyctis rosea]
MDNRGPSTYFAVPLAKTQEDATHKDVFRKSVANLGAFQRHQKFVSDYMLHYGGKKVSDALQARRSAHDVMGMTELDVLKQHHRFLRTEEDDADNSWEARVAKKYYDKLFKEYCLADLSRYKEGKVAMRWRTQKEVVDAKDSLRSWEVNFAYMEAGERKNALVKLRLCPECSVKLNWRKIKEQEEREEKEKRRKRKNEKERRIKRRRGEEEEDGEGEGRDRERRSKKEKRKSREESVSGSDERQEEQDEEVEDEETRRQREESRIWGAPLPEVEPEKSHAEELDDYFDGLFQ